MKLKSRIPVAILFCFALSAAWQSTVTVRTKDEIFPAPGNSCVFSTNPINNVGELPPTTVQWNFGGDAGVGGSNSRSVYIRPKGDGQEFVAEDGTRTPLTNGQTYVLRVNDFTVPVTSSPPPNRPAVLYSQGGVVAMIDLKLDIGTDWPIDDFFYTSGPGTKQTGTSLTGYLFDVTVGPGIPKDGFCVTFAIEGPPSSGNGSDFQASIQLNPDDNVPGTPQINFSFNFDDLDASTGDGEIQIDALKTTAIDAVNFAANEQGTITVAGMLGLTAANGQVTNVTLGKKSPVLFGSTAPGYLPAPDFTVIVMGSLTGSRQATLRFVPNAGQQLDFNVTQ